MLIILCAIYANVNISSSVKINTYKYKYFNRTYDCISCFSSFTYSSVEKSSWNFRTGKRVTTCRAQVPRTHNKWVACGNGIPTPFLCKRIVACNKSSEWVRRHMVVWESCRVRKSMILESKSDCVENKIKYNNHFYAGGRVRKRAALVCACVRA